MQILDLNFFYAEKEFGNNTNPLLNILIKRPLKSNK